MNFPVKPPLTVKVAARSAALRLSPLDLRELEQVLGAMLEALGFFIEPAPEPGIGQGRESDMESGIEPGNSAASSGKATDTAGMCTASPGLSLLLVDDREMEQCNRQAMNLPGPTNILSFPAASVSAVSYMECAGYALVNETVRLTDHGSVSELTPDSSLRQRLGELVLSVDTLKRESLLYWQDESEHLLWLLAHGLGHLGGCEQLGRGGLDHGTEHDKLSTQAFTAGLSCLKSIRSTNYE